MLRGAEGLIIPRIRTRKRKSINSAPCERSETSFALCDKVPGRYMSGPDVEPGFWSPAHVLWPVPKSFAGHRPPLRGAFLEPQGLWGRGLPKIEPFGAKRLFRGTRAVPILFLPAHAVDSHLFVFGYGFNPIASCALIKRFSWRSPHSSAIVPPLP